MVSNDSSGSAPAIEFDYGLVPNGQLTIDAPVAFDSPSGGSTQFGYGDTQLSFKYRFIQEDKDGFRPQVAVFPLVQFPTGDADRGLGVGHFVAFFPLWMQKSFGDWTTYGGGGYFLNRGGDDRDYWFVGGLLQRQLTESCQSPGRFFIKRPTKSVASTAVDSTWAPSLTSMNVVTSCFRSVAVSKTPARPMSSLGTWATK